MKDLITPGRFHGSSPSKLNFGGDLDVFLVFSLCYSDWLDLVMTPHSEVTSVSSSLQTSSLQPSSLPPAVLPPSSRPPSLQPPSEETRLRRVSGESPAAGVLPSTPLLASSPPSNPPRSLQTPPPGGPPPGGGLLHPDGLDQTSSLPPSQLPPPLRGLLAGGEASAFNLGVGMSLYDALCRFMSLYVAL